MYTDRWRGEGRGGGRWREGVRSCKELVETGQLHMGWMTVSCDAISVTLVDLDLHCHILGLYWYFERQT